MTGFIAELRKRNVLRVGAAYLVGGWLILQFVDVVFPMLGLDEALGRPILILLLVGLPISLVLAWVFELTPEGIKKEKDVDRSASVTSQTARKLDRVIIVVLICAVALLLADRFVLQSQPEEQQQAAVTRLNSVAVLPFVNLGGTSDNDYFSDGLTETLLHMLAQLPELKVAARTSVFSFKGKDIDIREVAAQLGVATVLEGSVQRSGSTVRITAQLIEAETGFHLWSQAFDRDLDDIFSVQDEIAANVAEKLQVTLLGGAAPVSVPNLSFGTRNGPAYERYLRALEQKNIASYGSLSAAEGLFKEALSLDSDFIEAKVELASTYILQAETGLLTKAEAETRLRPLLDQVFDVKPEHGRALGMLAAIDWDNATRTYGPNSKQSADAEQMLRKVVELAPNDTDLYFAMSNVAAMSKRNDEALEWIDKGLARDPLSARLYLMRGRLLLGLLDRPDEAEAAFAKGRELAPEWTAVVFPSARVAFHQGQFADGVGWYLRAMAMDPQDHELPAAIGKIYYQLGLRSEGDRMLLRAQALASQEPATRALELEKQLRANNYERAVVLAERMITDGVDNRGEAFNLAIMGYVGSMIELGKADAVASFFVSIKPGIGTPDFVPNGVGDLFMQFILVQALLEAGELDTANAILDSLVTLADTAVPDWRDNDYLMVYASIAQGDRQAAIEYALNDLDKPLGKQLGWDFNYQHVAWVKPLLKDERLAKRIAELEAERQAAGNDVQIMLQELGDARQASLH